VTPLQANLFQVVTFATSPLHGNPAFVLSDVGNAPDSTLMDICSLLRVEVIGVIDGPGEREPGLRFFTAEGSHAGPGHSSLAAAHLVLRHASINGEETPRGRDTVAFRLANGDRRLARATAERIAIGFPNMPASRVDRIDDVGNALGARPVETWVAPFGYVGIFEDADTIAALRPDMARVGAFDRTAIIATAPGNGASDIVVRVFAPNVGLPEDPVCGTAHRIIVPYWAERMGKTKLHSRHLSPRGGDLWCEVDGEEVIIAGESSLVIEGTVKLPER
jgi:predicted PhzF superfamily epimerase YddE/YHI9